MARWGFNTGLDGHRIEPLTEKEMQEIAEGLGEVYGWARERMLSTVAKRIASGRIGFGWAEKKAGEVNAAHAQLERDMANARAQRESILSGLADRATMTGSQRFYSDMQAMLGDVPHISPNSAKAAYILADLNNSLNAAERRILRQFDDRYADVIGAVSSELSTGVMNARQAVGDALRMFADQGITGFVDRGGHHWTLENYAEMATLTAIERATLSSYVDTMQSYGFDLAVIDGHAGSCPVCTAWEGVIVSVSGEDHRYPSLGEAENEGVFHPRCIHGITTYYPGISHEPKGGFRDEPRQIQPPSRAYTARSQQRYMERQIRKYKDRLIVAQTQQQKEMAKNKIREWTRELDKLIDSQPASNYMYRHRDRESARSKLTVQGLQIDQSSATMAIEKPHRSLLNSELPNGLPWKAEPNAIIDKLSDDGRVLQRRLYDEAGNAKTDYDTTNHNRPYKHPTGAHKHDLDSSKKNPHGVPQPLTDKELEDNADIIQRGVNYFDS